MNYSLVSTLGKKTRQRYRKAMPQYQLVSTSRVTTFWAEGPGTVALPLDKSVCKHGYREGAGGSAISYWPHAALQHRCRSSPECEALLFSCRNFLTFTICIAESLTISCFNCRTRNPVKAACAITVELVASLRHFLTMRSLLAGRQRPWPGCEGDAHG